jgi:hypothetical protein
MASPGRHTAEVLQHMEVELAAMRTAMYASAKQLSEGLVASCGPGSKQPLAGPLLLQQVQQLVGKKVAPPPTRGPSISEIQPADSPLAGAGPGAAASIGVAAVSGLGSAHGSQHNLLEMSGASSRRASILAAVQPETAPASVASSRRASVAASVAPAELASAAGSRRVSVAVAGPAEAAAVDSRRTSSAAELAAAVPEPAPASPTRQANWEPDWE